MKVTIDTKWVESLKDFDTETKVILYEAIFDYMSDEEVNLPGDTWRMFHMLKPMMDIERNRRIRQSGRTKKAEVPLLPDMEDYRSDDLRSLDRWMEEKTPYIYTNIRHMSQREFDALRGKFTSAQICDTLQQIENRKDLRKRYTNLYRTLLNWMKTEYGRA